MSQQDRGRIRTFVLEVVPRLRKPRTQAQPVNAFAVEMERVALWEAS